ncbi:MAG: TonB-dependent receptor [Methylococcaceae bacterium]|nr:TonB-dependent receptor [Methylococcaceae bacterium]
MNRLILFLVLINITGVVIAQSSKLACQNLKNADLTDVPLEELMEIPIFLGASQQAACTNEAANIVTTISNEEILTRGARDLTDVLQLVPGFSPGMSINGVTNMGIRGIGADEGKMSIFVDDIMLTEQNFSSTAMGGRFPIELIDRVEIIRGSSSIQNGNFAEMGVINIITKNAQQANGLAVTTDYGHFERGEARKNINVAAGKIFDDLEISFSGKANESQRSDRIYTDAHGASFDMANNSQLDSLYGNLNFKYKEFNLRLLSDDYNVESRDGYADSIQKNSYESNAFQTQAAKLDFEHLFNMNFKINSNFDFSRQTPWARKTSFDDNRPLKIPPKTIVDHYKFNGKATWMANSGSYLAIGNSYQMDDYVIPAASYGSNPNNPAQNLFFTDYTAYIEGVYKTDWADILAGGRFDHYNQFGSNFAPRFALTKQLDEFHYKLLYTQAFHVPTGGGYALNIGYDQYNQLGKKLEKFNPESTHTYEIEVGYQFTRNLDVTSNVFYTQIDNLFTYTFDENFDDYYFNAKYQATYGIESTVKYKNSAIGNFDLNYSFYASAKNSTPMSYQAFQNGNVIHPSMNLGFPTHKATLNHTFNFTSNFSFNHNVVFMSDRIGYSGTELKHYSPEWIYNTYLRYQNMPIKGAEIGLGLYDVFNARYQYVQQFNGSHPALPAEARELMLRFSYKF